jgi:hypothetical protein
MIADYRAKEAEQANLIEGEAADISDNSDRKNKNATSGRLGGS